MAGASLDGRTAVVTGAAGTLGLAIVRALLEDGARVALVDVDALRLDSLIRFLRGAMLAVPCDVSDANAVQQAFIAVEKNLGSVEILVNQASTYSSEKGEAATGEVWRRTFATNLDGAAHWCRMALPGMKQRRFGRILNVGCLGTPVDALPEGTALAAARGALERFTRSLAHDVAPFGITVNALAPAAIATASFEQLNDAQRRQLLARVPAGRACEPHEFAHAVRFFVAPEAGFVTGQVLAIDGGWQLA
ncbi:MAG TPA: SDR family NAD(P)-dependent oxidoreductase [Usitatibacter sp.]|nr:SDR family NAD(P)-dependent oxidoreductase [Usitatibacter sp.]